MFYNKYDGLDEFYKKVGFEIGTNLVTALKELWKTIVICVKIKYNKPILFIKEIFVKGGELRDLIRIDMAINCFIAFK